MEEQKRLLHVITRHTQFLTRVARMIAAGERGDELPEDAKFQTEEVKSLDGVTTDVLIEITGCAPNRTEWISPGRYAFENGYMKPGELTWLKSYREGLQRSKNYLQLFLTDSGKEIHLGDKITVGAAHVVMGSNARAGNISTQGSAQQGDVGGVNLDQLAGELSALRLAMRTAIDPDEPEHDIQVGAVALAEKSARQGDREGALMHLKSVGRWCLDVATKIGVAVATDAIKQASGLGK